RQGRPGHHRHHARPTPRGPRERPDHPARRRHHPHQRPRHSRRPRDPHRPHPHPRRLHLPRRPLRRLPRRQPARHLDRDPPRTRHPRATPRRAVRRHDLRRERNAPVLVPDRWHPSQPPLAARRRNHPHPPRCRRPRPHRAGQPMTGPWWEGPLWTYDTETTGTDPEHDRLVTLCLDHYDHPDATTPTDSLRLVIDPGVPIPETAAAVHGYDNQRATTEGITPINALLQLEEALAAVTATLTPVVVYNAVFDLTLTDREMRRHLHRPLALQFPVIDPLVIDRRVDRYVKGSGQRKLQPTATRY